MQSLANSLDVTQGVECSKKVAWVEQTARAVNLNVAPNSRQQQVSACCHGHAPDNDEEGDQEFVNTRFNRYHRDVRCLLGKERRESE